MQAINGTAEHCSTCLFPTYPYIKAIDVDDYELMDFSNKWVYFLGDVTVRQMYGELAAIVHKAQVKAASRTVFLLLNGMHSMTCCLADYLHCVCCPDTARHEIF